MKYFSHNDNQMKMIKIKEKCEDLKRNTNWNKATIEMKYFVNENVFRSRKLCLFWRLLIEISFV